MTPRQFAPRLSAELASLSADIRSGSYSPLPLRAVERERDGKIRVFAIPTVRDRIAQRSALDVLSRPLQYREHDSSFAYRRGRSWQQALRRVEYLRDRGLRHVYRFDIADFFGSIPHDRLRSRLLETFENGRVVDLLLGWVRTPLIGTSGMTTPDRGLPLGSALSAALANHFLTPMDEMIDRPTARLVRYADDGLVACADHDAALRARERAEAALRRLGLRAHPTKSYLSDFDRGVGFLGCVFHRDQIRHEPHSVSTERPRGR